MAELYQTLGLAPAATADEITKAFRKLAMQHHPDRETGNKELFQQVQEAYAVLSDPERRAQYDATGSADVPLSPEQLAERERVVKALHLVRSTLITVLLDPKVDPARVDVLAAARQRLTSARDAMVKETKSQIANLEQRKDRAQVAASRIAGDDEGTLADLLAGISAELDGPLANLQAHMDSEVDRVGAALDVLAKATYKYDQVDFAAMEREALQRLFPEAFQGYPPFRKLMP